MALQVIVIGGGVVGLSVAWDLARAGASVKVLDRGEIGQEASWAGAGMLPPTLFEPPGSLVASLLEVSQQRWPQVSADLYELTGIDNEFSCCGGLELTDRADGPLSRVAQQLAQRGVRHGAMDSCLLGELHPWVQEVISREIEVAGQSAEPATLWLPDFCQVRNPRHLQALAAACRKLNVVIEPHRAVREWGRAGERVRTVRGDGFEFHADAFVVCAGAWSQGLLGELSNSVAVEPVKGQMVLFHGPPRVIPHIVEVGKRYIVPRRDGHVLVGSTEEWTGFDKSTTAQGLAALAEFARELIPALRDCSIEKTWAGLRPYAPDRQPFVDRLDGYNNLWVATGHFRSGLQLSPGTAERITRLVGESR